MMAMIGNNFAYVTLCLFSATRLWIKMGSDVAMMCFNSLLWTSLYGINIYSIAHIGHFTKREVYLKYLIWKQ